MALNQAEAQRPGVLLVLLITLLLSGMLLATGLGFLKVPVIEVAAVLLHGLGLADLPAHLDPVTISVISEVRLPRVLVAVLVGGMLGISGGVFQAVLLNPLADSYTLGISTGAAFGASLVIVLQLFGFSLPMGVTVPAFAFGGGVLTLMAVLLLAAGDRNLASASLILAGVIVSAILSAGIGFLKFLADEQVGVIIFWLMGSLTGASWANISLLAPAALLGCLVTMIYGRDLNIMAAGDRMAGSLGINPLRLRAGLLAVCTLMTALAVSVSGIIGFVGLIVPHMLRHAAGPDNRALLPLSFVGGALLLLFADTLTRALLPQEMPIGVLTALLGGPFFCILFKRRQGHGRSDF